MRFEDQIQGVEDEAELQEMMDALATKAMDTNRPIKLRDTDAKNRVLVQQRINQLTSRAYTESPQDVLERLRQTNPDAATALEAQMGVDGIIQQASEVVAASMDENIANWRKPKPEAVDAAVQAAQEARNTPPPFFQAQIDRKAAQERAAGTRAAATAMQGSGEPSIQQRAEEMLQEADSIEAAIQR